MRAPISLIIPTLDAEARLPLCLSALTEGLHEGLIRELIISDGGSTDATLEIADAAGAVILNGPASRGGQMRRAAEQAKAPWLLFLHADTVLEEGWTRSVFAALAQPGAYHFRLKFDTQGPGAALVAGWANLRSRVFSLPYGDQGLLIDRRTYAAAGGMPDMPLMEDVALVRALPELREMPAHAVTSSAKFRRQGWLRRGARNLTTLTRYLAGTDPEVLARAYRR